MSPIKNKKSSKKVRIGYSFKAIRRQVIGNNGSNTNPINTNIFSDQLNSQVSLTSTNMEDIRSQLENDDFVFQSPISSIHNLENSFSTPEILNDSNLTIPPPSNIEQELSDRFSSPDILNDSNLTIPPPSNREQELSDSLAHLFLDFPSVPIVFANRLLSILRRHNISVPGNRDTLLGTRTVPPTFKKVMSKTKLKKNDTENQDFGQYLYFPIKEIIKSLYRKGLNLESFEIDIHVDGSRPANTSATDLWTVLGSVVDCPLFKPFIIGVYSGQSQPDNLDDLLSDLCNDIHEVSTRGLNVRTTEGLERTVFVKIRILINDAPARAKLNHTKAHQAICGCGWCLQNGYKALNSLGKKQGAMVYSHTRGPIFTGSMYASRYPPEKFDEYALHNFSPLELIGVDMVDHLPPDAMHGIDLGAGKKIISCILEYGTPFLKLTPLAKDKFNQLYESFKHTTPCEFQRKPVRFDKISPKATDYRRVLLYHGLVLFKKFMPSEMFDHYLLLYCALKLMNEPETCKSNAAMAQRYLDVFVENFSKFYGQNKLSYCIHILLHYQQFVEKYGPIYSWSAYKYESKIGEIHNLINSMNLHLSQIYRRVYERNMVENTNVKEEGPILIRVKQSMKEFQGINVYKGYDFKNFRLKTTEADSYFLLKAETCDQPAKFMGLVLENREYFILFKNLLNRQPVFIDPFNSDLVLKVFSVSGLDNEIHKLPLNRVLCKLFCHKDGEVLIMQPLNHVFL